MNILENKIKRMKTDLETTFTFFFTRNIKCPLMMISCFDKGFIQPRNRDHYHYILNGRYYLFRPHISEWLDEIKVPYRIDSNEKEKWGYFDIDVTIYNPELAALFKLTWL